MRRSTSAIVETATFCLGIEARVALVAFTRCGLFFTLSNPIDGPSEAMRRPGCSSARISRIARETHAVTV